MKGKVSKVIIRTLQSADLKEVSQIHMRAFPASALTKLGAEAVSRYYRWLLEGPHEAVNLVAELDSDLVGFCFAGVFRGAMSGFLKHNRNFLVSNIMRKPWLVANPLFRERLVNAARITKRNRKSQTPNNQAATTQRPFGILAVAVDPRCQGLGVGRLLMEKAEENARARGFTEMILTVSPSNSQAIRFYQNLDWTRVTSNGGWNGGMKKLLNASKPDLRLTQNKQPKRVLTHHAA